MKVESRIQSSDRKFRWMSSTNGNQKILSDLNEKMACFYGSYDRREHYQAMLESLEENYSFEEHSDDFYLPNYILSSLQPKTVLEVGCSNGRVYRQLRTLGYVNEYYGIEVALYLIQRNKQLYPEAIWRCAGAYEIPFSDNYFDVCFSAYVLEHLIWPERALKEMIRVIRPGGHLVLQFPDFVESGRFASQQLGFSVLHTSSQKIRSGRFFDALVSLYDSRLRLKLALKSIRSKVGSFPVNLSPIALSNPNMMSPDVDAIYIASKSEVADWALENRYKVEYPYGTKEHFKEHAFMSIQK